MPGSVNAGSAVGYLDLNIKGFSSGLSSASSIANTAFSGLKKAGSVMSTGITTAFKGITTAIAATSSAVTAIGGLAVKVGSDYETGFGKVRTIMDSSQKSVEDMGDEILKLSSNMGIANDEIADTVYNVISSTGDTANAVSIAEYASKLAIAGFTDSTSALGVLTTAMNAYGLSAGEVNNISDSLIVTQNLGVTTVAELSNSMGKAIASASAYGVDLYNVEAAYIAMTKAGINTHESTTYMSGILKELGDTSSDVGKILVEKTGKSFAELTKDGKSLADVLGILYDSVGKDSSAMINLWGSVEAGKGANAIINQGLDTFNENLIKVSNSAGITQTAYETMADTFSKKLSVIKETGKNLLVSLYNGMESQRNSLLDFASDAINTLKKGFEENGVQGMIDAAGLIISNLVTSLANVAPKLIQSGVDLIKSIIVGLKSSSSTILEGVSSVVDSILSGFNELLPEFTSAGFDIVVKLLEGINQNLGTFLEVGSSLFADFLSNFMANKDKMRTSAIDIINKLLEGFDEAFPVLLSVGGVIITDIVNGVGNLLPKIFNVALDIIQQVVEAFADNIDKFIALGKNIIVYIYNGIVQNKGKLKSLAETLFRAFVSVATTSVKLEIKLLDFGNKFFYWLNKSIANAAASFFRSIANLGKSIVDVLMASIKGIFSGDSAEIKNLISGIFGTASEAVADATGTMTIVFDKVKGLVVKKWDDIDDTLFESASDTGVNQIDAYIASVTGKKDELGTTGVEIVTAVSNGVELATPVLATATQTLIDNATESSKPTAESKGAELGDKYGDAYAKAMKLKQKMQKQFDDADAAAEEAAKQSAQKLQSIISSSVGSLFSAVTAEDTTDAIDGALDVASNILSVVIPGWGSLISAGINLLQDVAKNTAEDPDYLTKLSETLVTNLTAIIEFFLEDAPSLIIDMFYALVDAVIDTVFNLFSDFGVHLIEGLWEGIKKAFSSLWKGITNLFSSMWNGILSFFGIHSPSKKGMWAGEMLAKGFGNGFKDEFGKVTNDITSMYKDFSDIPIETPKLAVGSDVAYTDSGNVANTNTNNSDKVQSGNTYNFYSPKALSAYDNARLVEKTNRNLVEGF